MGALASPFCEHKKLRTACATCRPPPPPKPEGEARVKAKPAAPRATHDDGPEAAAPRPRAARRQKPPTRAESEAAEAWWVKKK